MIISAYGVAGLTCMELVGMLIKLNISFGVVHRTGLKKHPGSWAPQKVFPVVFTSATAFLQTYKKFGKSKVIAFVVDNPFALHKELTLPLLAAEMDKTRVTFGSFTSKDLQRLLGRDVILSTPLEFERTVYTPVKDILRRYAASDLASLQTFLYRIKDVDKRNEVGRIVKTWLVSSRPLTALETELSKKLDGPALTAVKRVLHTPSIPKLRIAVAKARTKPGAINGIAKSMGLSPFDIRYLLSTK